MIDKNKRIIEICINADDSANLVNNVTASIKAGAARIELCGQMMLDGLTPDESAIKQAKSAMLKNGELLVMVRPHNKSFCYSDEELTQMNQQIIHAAKLGADGVVFGVLTNTNTIDLSVMSALITTAKQHQLAVTFHRAFDVIEDYALAVEQLADLGIDRLLTSGGGWQQPTTINQRLTKLTSLCQQVAGRFELVVGGGVTLENAQQYWQHCQQSVTPVSLHTYSKVLDNQGRIDPLAIHCLKATTDN
ncbi:copper homeostasis protein CutC [Colwellia sp. MEBiC06753]